MYVLAFFRAPLQQQCCGNENKFQGRFRTFYKESFSKIEKYKSKTLILDLHCDNGGGRLNEIVNLYSYLADSVSFFFEV
jgi:C-terminal processing protease CtpA/Prc